MSALDAPDLGAADAAQRLWLDTQVLQQRFRDHLTSGLTRELWKYTPLPGFMEAMPAAGEDAVAEFSGLDQRGVRALPFADMAEPDAREVQQLLGGLEAPRHLLADLCLLRARGGWLIEVTDALQEPLIVRFRSGGNLPLVVLVRPGARATLVESAETDRPLAQLCLVDLQRDAALAHHRAALQAGAPHWSLQQVRLQDNASYDLGQHLAGGRRRRAETHVILDGRGAQATLKGAYVVEDGQHLDQQLTVEHRAGDTRSRQVFHGIGCGKGRSIFNGRIHIHPDAQKTRAELSNRNLLTSADAEVNTKPELEIYADDVQCAHGATVARLDATSLHYLRSRGISRAEAEVMLSFGFINELLDEIRCEALTGYLRPLLARRLARDAALSRHLG